MMHGRKNIKGSKEVVVAYLRSYSDIFVSELRKNFIVSFIVVPQPEHEPVSSRIE